MAARLSTTNSYMRDPATRERLVYRSVASSSAVEGIREPFRRKATVLGKKAGPSARKRKRR
jgi:hypothetical protein